MPNRKLSGRQVKADLRRLKAKGLYTAKIDPNRPVTASQRKAVEEYRDVLSGRAKVVTVPKRGKHSSKAEAKALAADLGAKYKGVVRAKGDKVIVRTAMPGERVSIRNGGIVTRYKNKSGETVIHEYTAPGSALPELRAGETYALPFSRGTDGVSYEMRATPEEILQLANEYEQHSKNPYRGATGYIQVVTKGNLPRRPRRSVRNSRGAEIIPFPVKRRR